MLGFASHPGNPSWGPGSQSSVLTGRTQGCHKRAELFATNFFLLCVFFLFWLSFYQQQQQQQNGEEAERRAC